MSIRQGLLTLLDRAPLHGYELRRQFESVTGNTWPLNVGQVYTTLARLERDGLIVAVAAEALAAAAGDAEPDSPGDAQRVDAHRVYEITPAGRTEVRTWFTTPVQADAPPRDELAIKLALAARTPGVDLAAVIQIQRSATMLALQTFTRARERAGSELSWQLVADSLIFAAEAELRWLDHCEVRLARARLSTAQTVSDADTASTHTAPTPHGAPSTQRATR